MSERRAGRSIDDLPVALLTSAADRHAPSDRALRHAYATLIESLRQLQDAVAASAPPAGDCLTTHERLDAITATLRRHTTPETGQLFNRLPEFPGHGQSFTPAYAIDHVDDRTVDASVQFTRFHMGGGAAAHGGAVALVFDSLLGRLVNSSNRRRSRTVHLGVDYRRITPVDTTLQVRGSIERIEGRKRYAKGVLVHDGEICAEATGIFAELLDHQQ